ncbi:hypothetical protein WJU16_07185 [Chitinophaga pollutisoli]|uniref:Lipoprotein n=1 Tax=Chitinophaga pollutisoli TaxID=3133966 RepID=A0ABZ2YST9_9BACT
MKLIALIIPFIILLTACTADDQPDPTAEYSLDLTSWSTYNYKLENTNWIRQEPNTMLVKYHDDGRINTIENALAGPDPDNGRLTVLYDQGKFSGIAHISFEYTFVFNDGRLRKFQFRMPTDYGHERDIDTIIYDPAGKLDYIDRLGTYGINGKDRKYKVDFVWEGENLKQYNMYMEDDAGQMQVLFKQFFTYNERLQINFFPKLRGGADYFFLKLLAGDRSYLLSKHLPVSSERIWTSRIPIPAREVFEYTHRLDAHGRLQETEIRAVRYEYEVWKSEIRTAIGFTYRE